MLSNIIPNSEQLCNVLYLRIIKNFGAASQFGLLGLRNHVVFVSLVSTESFLLNEVGKDLSEEERELMAMFIDQSQEAQMETKEKMEIVVEQEDMKLNKKRTIIRRKNLG